VLFSTLIFCCIALCGVLFLFFSAVTGHFEISHDVSVEHEVSHDGHAEKADAGPSPFSLRVIAIFMTGFGSTAAIASSYNLSITISILIGLGAGIICGLIAYLIIRTFWSQQASSTVSQHDFVGSEGVVSVEIPEKGIGQVAIIVKSQQTYLSAHSCDAKVIEQGRTVIVKEYFSGVATVSVK
jgi:hypothetical protein